MICRDSGIICDFGFYTSLGTCFLQIKGFSILPVYAKVDPWSPFSLLILSYPHNLCNSTLTLQNDSTTVFNCCSLFQLSAPHLCSPTKCFHCSPPALSPAHLRKSLWLPPKVSFFSSFFCSSTPMTCIRDFDNCLHQKY